MHRNREGEYLRSVLKSEPLPTVSDPVQEIPPDLITEKALADSWRLSVKDVAAMRHAKLRRALHWDIVHYTVCYTKDGVEKLKDLIAEGFLRGELKEKPVKDDLVLETAAKLRWKVVRVPPNPRMLLIQNEWSLEHAWLNVKHHRNFKKGMIIKSEDLSPPDVMGRRTLIGRMPRFHGRW